MNISRASSRRRPGNAGPTFEPVRALLRGLDVLAAVNQGQAGSVAALAQAVGLPRATVIRLLETLEGAGYIAHTGPNGRYDVSPRVTVLSSAFDYDAWLAAIAQPQLRRLMRRIHWPSDLMVRSGESMIVLTSNRGHSGLNINRRYAGMMSSIFNSGSGFAYLAWCDDAERQRIMAARTDPAERAAVEHEIARTRARGYGVRDISIPPGVGAIATPVLVDGRAVACLNVVYLPRMATAEVIARQCLPALRAAAQSLGRAIGRGFDGDRRR
ncbi:MAG TPA: helix-turn-helix domain-containing protein [Vineibacter sp.]|nr:helix-turn-helix domain-containing protein [Vineibacter sp.]